jgi:RNA polymerase sigma-70 factor (ECF subfamily)
MNDDAQLLSNLRMGRQDAFEAIFKQHWQDLYTIAYQRMRDKTVAEDLVQDIFTNLWERHSELDIQSPLQHYLRKALKYKIIRLASRANLHQEALKHLLDRVSEMESTILDKLNVADVNRTLSEVILGFPENMRQIFTLRAENYTIAEIAEVLGLAEQTVKNNTTEALKRIRTVLGEKHPDIPRTFFALLVFLIQG